MKDIIQSYFNQEAVAQLGQVAGFDPTLTQRALSLGLPLQLDALAAHAQTPEGRAQIGEAVGNLPRFGSVQDALNAPGGALDLQRAGELLSPALLGNQSEDIVQQVTRRVGGSVGGVQKVMNMALPLVLSLLGRQGLDAANAATMLGGLRGGLGDLDLGTGLTGAGVAGAAVVPPPPPAGGAGAGVTAAQLAPGAVTPSSLLDTLRAEFSGENADRIGRAAGFSGAAASKAVLGALPVVLSALVNRGRTEAGAAELLSNSQDLDRLTGEGGHLNASLLSDSAEMARLEGQGRGVLAPLYGNVDALTGRLGTALGGSGAGAGRLLALLTPLVLSVLGRVARNSRMSPLVLSGLLGAMQDKLPGLIPAGMGGIAGLLSGSAVAEPVKQDVVAAAAPAARVADKVPAPVTPPPPSTPVTTTTAAVPTPPRRGGFPWWLLLIPLLIGGCWYLNNQNKTTQDKTTQTTTRTTTQTETGQDSGIVVTTPAESGSNLPAEPFTMSGTAAPDMHLKIEDQGDVVAEATADAEGNWTAEIPAPTPGEHTYSVIGGEGAKTEFKVNITDTDAASDGDAAAGDTAEGDASGGSAAGDFAINEPAENAEVAATGFNLTGTGKAGETYELLEDGTSVGTFTVGEDGKWSADVAAPTAGDKTYTIQDSSGNEVATLPVKVAAGTASASECSEDLSVSLEDGETVTAPFRFGGVGNSENYTVTIRRGDRVVGTKKIALSDGCTWSYSSNPGGRSGTVNDVTYEVRAGDTAASAPADATLNLKVRAR